jgi:hypothetical protein
MDRIRKVLVMAVDWTELRLKAGDLVCPEHGVITDPMEEGVLACPLCLRLVTRAAVQAGQLVHVQPAPARCPHGHPLGAGQVLLGWAGCQCTPTGGHHTWRCLHRDCGGELRWPPHIAADSPPYFGPGHDDAWRSGA